MRRALLATLVVAALLIAVSHSREPPPTGPTSPPAAAPEPPASAPGEVRLAPAAGAGVVEGVVIRGGATAAAEVRLFALADGESAPVRLMRRLPRRPPPIAVAHAGEDGRFRLAGLPLGAFEVRAVTGDGARGRARAALRGDAARDWVRIDLPTGTEVVQGVAVRSDGRPYEGHVGIGEPELLAGFQFPYERYETVPVGPGGRFRIDRLEPGPHRLFALEPGRFFRLGAFLVLPREAPVTFVVDEDLAEISGRVVAAADGTAIAGAVVESRWPGGEAAATTDESGSFRLPALPDHEWFLARAEGYREARCEGTGEGFVPLLRLERVGAVSGRVLDAATSRPVAGIPVFVDDRRAGVSGPDGRYEIRDLPPGLRQLRASGGGRVSRELADVRLGRDGALGILVSPGASMTRDLYVVPAGRLEGRVIVAGGDPGGAVVRAAGMSEFLDVASPPLLTTVADGEGRFVFDELVPGLRYEVRAEVPGRAPVRGGPFAAAPDEVVELQVEVPPARFLEVRVLDDETGAPLAGAVVRPATEWSGAGRTGAGRTGPDGRALVGPLPPVAEKLEASCDGYVAAFASAGPGPVEVRLSRGVTIRGRVLLPDGTPAVGARLRFSSSGYDDDGWATTDAAGHFARAGFFPMLYGVRIQHREGRRERFSSGSAKAGGEPVEFMLEEPETATDPTEEGLLLRLRVLDDAGREVALCRVEVVRGWAREEVEGIASGGSRAIRCGGPDGEILVGVSHARDADGAALGATVAGPFRGDAGEVAIRLSPTVAIAGRVSGPDGRGVAGVAVRAFRESAVPALEEARTDGAGAFRIEGLDDGPWILLTVPPLDFARPGPVEARGGSHDVEIALVAAAAPTIRVIDERGAPVPGARVLVDEWTEDRAGGETDADGRVRLRGLAPGGRCQISLAPPGNRSDLSSRRMWGWIPADSTFTLGPKLAVSGRVVDEDGSPVAGARVTVRAEGCETADGTGEDGRFRVTDLPPGEVRLSVDPGEGRRGLAPLRDLRVRAGTDGLTLTLPRRPGR